MIALLQKSFKTKAFKVFMWVILLTLGGVFSFIEIGRQYFGSSGSWVALVNGDKILQADFIRHAQSHKERIDSLRAQYPEYAEMILQQLGSRARPEQAALDALIRQHLIESVAKGTSLPASDEAAIARKLSDIRFVQQELSDLMPLYAFNPATGGFNMQLVRNHLHRMGISVEDFHAYVSDAINREAVMKIAQLSSYVPEFELKNRFVQDFSGKRFAILKLNSDALLKEAQKKSVTDEQLKNYFDAHKNEYRIPEKRAAKAYSFTASSYGVNVSDADILAQYEKNKSAYVANPARVQVRRILFKVENPDQKELVRAKAEATAQKLLENPSSFAQIAKEVSEDASSAAKGGLLEPMAKGTQDPVFDRVAFTLKDDGSISSVFETKNGFEILQRVNKTAQQYKPLADVKKQIQDTLIAQRFSKQFASEVRALLDGASFNQDALKAFVQKHGGIEKKHTDLVNNGFPLAQLVYKMNVGQTDYSVQESQGTIATLLSIDPSSLPEFQAVKDKVKEEWYLDQANQLLSKTVAQAKEKAEAGQTLGAVHQLMNQAKQYAGALEETGTIKASDTQEIKRLERMGVPVQQMLGMEKVGSVISVEKEGDLSNAMPGAKNSSKKRLGIVVRLEHVEPYDNDLYQSKKLTLGNEQARHQESLTGSGFIASLYRNATIDTNNELLQYQ